MEKSEVERIFEILAESRKATGETTRQLEEIIHGFEVFRAHVARAPKYTAATPADQPEDPHEQCWSCVHFAWNPDLTFGEEYKPYCWDNYTVYEKNCPGWTPPEPDKPADYFDGYANTIFDMSYNGHVQFPDGRWQPWSDLEKIWNYGFDLYELPGWKRGGLHVSMCENPSENHPPA